MSQADTFQVRVKAAFGENFAPCMRRSLLSVVLYEADRRLMFRYPQLHPWQKQIALHQTAVELLKTLDFLNDTQRQEVMYRTNSSKDLLSAELAWRRMKRVTSEVNSTIVPKAKELINNGDNKGKSHEEICTLLLQKLYEEATGNPKPYPPLFEFKHNKDFTVYRIYYRGCAAHPNIFPVIPSLVPVPAEKPANMEHTPKGAVARGRKKAGENSESLTPPADVPVGPELSVEERRAMLKEVKEHTELLRVFEGAISDEEMVKRKRALYAAMPPVPPPTATVVAVGEGRYHWKKTKVG